MAKVIRLTSEIEEYLNEIDTNINKAIKILIDGYIKNKQEETLKDTISRIIKEDFCGLSDKQELHVKMLIREALDEARQGY